MQGMVAGTAWKRLVAPVLALAMLAALSVFLAAPSQAFAASSPKIIVPTKAQDIAYNRCVKAAMNYKKLPQTITVDISDLKLTKAQLVDVETRVHSNGELWWVNTFALGLSVKQITLPCKYDDATINKMRVRFDRACVKALKRIGPGMYSSTKVHMLHDYLVQHVVYQDHCKNAYEALVNKRADCFGYTLANDVLLRRAGFKTDVAYNNDPNVDHSWNQVKLGSKWYHVDVTWDRYFTYNLYKGKICHSWVLQSDKTLNNDDHKGWEAHHRCTDSSWFDASFMGEYFSKHCKDYKSIVRSFSKSGLNYAVTVMKNASVNGVAKAKRSAKTLEVPAKAQYKGVTYAVTGLKANAFKRTSAKTLVVNTTKLSKESVKNSLAGSKVNTVKVPKSKLKAYKRIFTKANAGKKVKVVGLTGSALRKAALKAQSTVRTGAVSAQGPESTALTAAGVS